MRKSISMLIAALAVAVAAQASPQAFAQTAPASKDAGSTTTLSAQQQKKPVVVPARPAPVRSVARPAAPVRSVARPVAPTRNVTRPTTPTRSVAQPTRPTRTIAQPTLPTRNVAQPTKPGTGTAAGVAGGKPGLTQGQTGKTGLTQGQMGKPGLTQGQTGKTGLTQGHMGKPGLTQGQTGKTGLTQGQMGKPGLTQGQTGKTGLTQGPGSRTGKTGLTQGPGSRTGKTGLTQGPGSRTGKTGLTQGPGSRTGKIGLTRGPGSRTGRIGAIPGRDRGAVNRVARGDRGNYRGWTGGPRNIAINRDRRRIFVNNGWRTLVPLLALGTFVYGAETLYADGYVSMPEPVCTGFTEDGTRLRWMSVPTEDGGSEYQCVAYSAQRNRTVTQIVVPDAAVAEAPGAPETVGVGPSNEPAVTSPVAGCELQIYSEANFNGLSAPVDGDQPGLGEEGWKNEIASVQIKSGTWDFYSDEDFAGEMMRLSVGSYPTLDPKWNKNIGSFMCSAPGK
jgi:hypothetical protein